MNFMEAVTIIEDLASKRDNIYKKVASTISEAITSKKTTDGIVRFLDDVLKDFNETEKVSILTSVIINLLLGKGYSSGKNSEKKARSERINDFFD